MSGRIATIRTDVATLGDYRSRALLGDQRGTSGDGADDQETGGRPPSPELEPTPHPAPSLAPPAEPSGTSFVAAVAAGSLLAPPPAMREILLRRNVAWSPPESDLHLTDRTA